MSRPVFLVLSPDGEALAADLRRRYDADYRTVAVPDTEALSAALRKTTDPVALLIVDERVDDAVGVLDSARELHSGALRVLLVERGQWSASHPAVGAMALGRIDYHLFRPWWPLERILYGSMAEFLSTWENAQPPAIVAFQIVGEPQSTASHRLRDLFTRIGIPYRFHDADSPDGRRLLHDAGTDRIPIVLTRDGRVLIQPTHAELTAWFGIPARPPVESCDVAIAGAGPAGLAAAVYAASEGLSTVVIEPAVPGGQAGTSSLIRNYLGFPRGVSGFDLTNRALEQVWLFGAHLVVAAGATRIAVDGDTRLVWTGDGPPLAARTVVIATGVSWRRLGVPSLEALIGAGVFYGAAGAEALAVEGGRAYVVGAGNSAGQAALHLA
ncbi:MAG TPA: FAD-dependent oxidoreductase, partial [Actinoplanes sp.]